MTEKETTEEHNKTYSVELPILVRRAGDLAYAIECFVEDVGCEAETAGGGEISEEMTGKLEPFEEIASEARTLEEALSAEL